MLRVIPRLDGQVAIVRGAGRGLGRAYALQLARQGATVVVNNRVHAGVESSARKLASEINDSGGRAVIDEHSVMDEEGMTAMIERAVSELGSVDILVCNAGIGTKIEFADATIADLREMIDSHIWGTIYPLRPAWKVMLARRYGRIVLTSSSAAVYGLKGYAIYGAAKAAMLGLARGLACEAPEGGDFAINLILPVAHTAMAKVAKDGAVADEYADLFSPERVATVVAWLISGECKESGMIIRTGGGKAARIRIMQNEAVAIDPEDDVGMRLNSTAPETGLTEYRDLQSAGRAVMPELWTKKS